MTERQKNKNLFDALLKVAVAEAFETEMDALPADGELAAYAPTPALDRRVGVIISRNYRKMKAKRALRTIGKTAAGLCVLLTVACVVLFSVDATRIAIFNAVIEWRDKYTSFEFENSSGSGFNRPAYLPAGYTEKSAEFHEIIAQIVYENSAGDTIVLNEQKAGSSKTAVDNERHDYSEIQLGGVKAFLFTAKEKGEANILLWETHGVVYTLLSTLDTGELIKIGESL